MNTISAAAVVSLTANCIDSALPSLPVDRIAERLGFRQTDDMFAALGSGDVSTAQLANAVSDLVPQGEVLRPRNQRVARRTDDSIDEGISIQGVGNLLTTMARCCRPVPSDPIVGYITRGRGVTIHRQDCGHILRLQGDDRARLIEVDWGSASDRAYQVDILVEAYDRSGLLRDITSLLSNEKINLSGANTATDENDGIARMQLTLEIRDISQLSRVLTKISQLSNVITARRKV